MSLNFGRENSVRKPVAVDLSQHLMLAPPQAIDLEETVLGAAILEREGQLVAIEKLTPEDFYKPTHAEIFTAICELAKSGIGIDMRSVVAQLKKTGKLESAGGQYTIAELTTKANSSSNIEYYCAVLIEKRIARDIITFTSQMQRDAYKDTTDVFLLIDLINKFPLQILEKVKVGTERPIKDGVLALTKRINERTTDAPEITGIPSGYPSLDRITRGWQITDLIIIAARPSMGKTTFVINVLRNAAIEFKTPVGLYSLEMSYTQLVDKMVSAETDISLRDLTSKAFSRLDWDRFSYNTAELINAPIYIDDPASLNIQDLRARCRRLVEKYGVKMIAVDYLQLLRGEHGIKNREQEIASISRGLKQIAKELKIPVIALSQLSREVDTRPLPRIPVMSDLRESGAIEQDADIVAFLWKPAYYKLTGDEGGTYVQGLTKIIIAKHRNGGLGEPCVAMEAGTSKFRGIDSPYVQASKQLATGAVVVDSNNTPTPTPDEIPF